MGTVAAAIVALAGVIAGVLITSHSGNRPAASPASSLPVPQTPSGDTATDQTSTAAGSGSGQPGTELGHGTLTLEDDGTAYDLDAVNTGWAPLAGHSWITQNIMYAPTGNRGSPVIDIAGSPYTDVVMSGSGPWTYADCAKAPYGANPSTKGPNAVSGESFKVGKGICVETQNTSIKSDGNHIALLVIKSIGPHSVTLDVTVWWS